MRARVVRSFRDLKAGVERKEGEVFEVDEERFAEINRKLNGYLAEEREPPAKKPAGAASRRRPAAKAREPRNK